jgi:hypothetical protein
MEVNCFSWSRGFACRTAFPECTINASGERGRVASFWLGVVPKERYMPRLLVNNEEQPLENGCGSWGEVLSRLDRDAVARGEVVTEVRFDGVDDPSFWQPSQVDRVLSGIAAIEVQTASQSHLVSEALAQGVSAAGTLSAAATEIATMFRDNRVTTANERLAELCEGTGSMITLSNTAATALGLELDVLEWNGRTGSVQIAALVHLLESIIKAQQTHDWLTVADFLEYDLHPALIAWLPVFETLSSAAAAHATR